MSDPAIIEKIMEAVSIPVMAKCRIGHFAEAQVLEALGVDFIDESEVLTPADEKNHVDKFPFRVPFVCGCRNLGEALRRIGEGAAMIRTKGEAGTGDVVEAVRHGRAILSAIRKLTVMAAEERMTYAKEIGAPYELVITLLRSDDDTLAIGTVLYRAFKAAGDEALIDDRDALMIDGDDEGVPELTERDKNSAQC